MTPNQLEREYEDTCMEEDAEEVSEIGDIIRTKKNEMEGKIEKIVTNHAGQEMAYFRIADGRLMRTPLDNTIKVQKLADGSMGGINRCAPSNDVSYEKVLDDVTEEWDKFNLPKPKKQSPKLATKKLDTAPVKKPKLPESFEDRLKYFLKEVDFSDILKKQYADDQAKIKKPEVVRINFHGWEIRYRKGIKPTDPVQWAIFNKKGDKKHEGTALNDKEAVGMAEDWITKGGDYVKTGVKATGSVNIDFNVDFSMEFAPEGETFYATLDRDGDIPMLIISYEPQEGFKKSYLRHQRANSRLAGITISANDSNNAGLIPHGRYILGNKDAIDQNTAMFPLILQSVMQGKGDLEKLGRAGLTVAANEI